MNPTDLAQKCRKTGWRRLAGLSRRFARHRGGLAAIEFAIVLPLMLLLYLGSFEISQAVAIKRQVTLTASTVANIVSQYATISATADLPDILNASSVVLTPYSSSNAVVTVSVIGINSTGKATVTWSQSLHGTARTVGQTVTLPAALDVDNTSLVLGETTYAYTPIMDFMKVGTLSLYSSVYMFPRSSSGTILLTP